MKSKRAYLIATAHLDTVWRWNLATTIEEYIPNTISKNLYLFKKHPHYCFNFEGVYRYELIEEYYSEYFETIKKYVNDGKWCPCGSSYENGDVNIPSPESLFRNILYGNSYFKNKFGKETCDIFLPDCFGFSYALPTIMAHSGLKGFSTQKLTWGCANGIPFDIGYWQGVDGSKVFAAIDAKSYRSKLQDNIRKDNVIIDKINANGEKYEFPQTLNYYGVGDLGGAPDENSVINLENAIKENDLNILEVLSSSTQNFFNDLDNLSEKDKKKLPVFDGELIMTSHGTGAYTSRTMVKRLNAQNEILADLTEKACVTADVLGVYDYPTDNITKAWKRVIRHHFHDDITGTSIMEVYNDSCNDYYVSLNEFKNEYVGAVDAITNKLDTSFTDECAVIVNNPSCFDRKDNVNAHIKMKHNCKFIKVLDKEENEVPSQVIKKTGKEFDISFVANVKALGFKVYNIIPSNETCKLKTDLVVTEHSLENSKYKVILNKNGDIASITDKELNKQILESPVKLALLNDTGSKRYPSWEINKSDIDSEPFCYANSPKFEIVENGPAKIAIKVTREIDYSKVTQIISLSSESKYISVYNFVDWQSRRKMLKVIFPFSAYNEYANYDLGIGVIKRKTNSENMYEVPAQKWADISDEDNSFGVSIFSDCKYGWDKPNNNTLRLTCIHTPAGAFNNESRQDLQDIGRNIFSFGIFSHSGNFNEDTQIQNELFQKPLIAFQSDLRNNGEFKDEFSFAKITNGNILIKTIKKAENGNGFILRVTEPNGKNQENVSVKFFRNIEKCNEVFANEEFKNNVQCELDELIFNIKPFEVKSFRINLNEEKKDIINSSTPIKIKYNTNGFTSNKKRDTSNLAGTNCSLPLEQRPNSLNIGGIHFDTSINNKDFDILISDGQEIEIPKETKEICIIAASTTTDQKVEFSIGSKKKEITVHSFNEPIGTWDMFGLNQKAYLKDANTAIEFTHLHCNNKDLSNAKAYFFMYRFKIKNEHKIILPKNNDIIIFAITALNKKSNTTISTNLIDNLNDDNYEFGKIAPVEKVVQKTNGLVTDVKQKMMKSKNDSKIKIEKTKNSLNNFIKKHF